jgi:penicillin-binding protein 1A
MGWKIKTRWISYDIYKDGLKYTPQLIQMQLHAEEAVSAHMANLQEKNFSINQG